MKHRMWGRRTSFALMLPMLAGWTLVACGEGEHRDIRSAVTPEASGHLAETLVTQTDEPTILSVPESEDRYAIQLILPPGFVDRYTRVTIDAADAMESPAVGLPVRPVGAPLSLEFVNTLSRWSPRASTFGEAFLVYEGPRSELASLALAIRPREPVALFSHPILGRRYSPLELERFSLASDDAMMRFVVPIRLAGIVQLAMPEDDLDEVPKIVRDEPASADEPKTSNDCDNRAPAIGDGLVFADLTETGMTVSWGAANDDFSAEAELEYKVVYNHIATEIDTPEEANASETSSIVLDWTAGATTAAATDLQGSPETLFFAVIVRDKAGNMSLYPPLMSTDHAAPAPGTSPAISEASKTGMTVAWGAATDDVSSGVVLRYKVVRTTARANIDTVDEVNAATGSMVAVDWTENLTSTSLTGLLPGVTYHVAIAVKDAVGNVAIYDLASETTLSDPDGTAPTTGAPVDLFAMTASGMKASWGAAADGATLTADLEYRIVIATDSSSIDTVEEVAGMTGGAVSLDWTKATLSTSLTGLASGTTYYVAVAVRDAAGNIALYPIASAATGS